MNLDRYYKSGNEMDVQITTTVCTQNTSDLEKLLHDYYEKHWVSEFKIKMHDHNDNIVFVELKSEGYEAEIKLYFEGEHVASPYDEEEAMKGIEKLFMERV